MLELAERNPETFLVSTIGDRVVGYAVADDWKTHDHLVSIAVHPDHWKRGIGSQLLEQLESRLAKNRRPMELEVRKSNIHAIDFYLKHDFEKADIKTRYYADGEDAILMRRRGRRP